MQKNGTDCGIFVCQVWGGMYTIANLETDINFNFFNTQYAKHLAFERELLFTQVLWMY